MALHVKENTHTHTKQPGKKSCKVAPFFIPSFGLDENDELLVCTDSKGHDNATYIAGNSISTYGNKTVDLWLRNKVNVFNNLTIDTDEYQCLLWRFS